MLVRDRRVCVCVLASPPHSSLTLLRHSHLGGGVHAAGTVLTDISGTAATAAPEDTARRVDQLRVARGEVLAHASGSVRSWVGAWHGNLPASSDMWCLCVMVEQVRRNGVLGGHVVGLRDSGDQENDAPAFHDVGTGVGRNPKGGGSHQP